MYNVSFKVERFLLSIRVSVGLFHGVGITWYIKIYGMVYTHSSARDKYFSTSTVLPHLVNHVAIPIQNNL